MDEHALIKILEENTKKRLESQSQIKSTTVIDESDPEYVESCVCLNVCKCKVLNDIEEVLGEGEEDKYDGEYLLNESEETDEEDISDQLSVLSEEKNLMYRKRVLCDRKARPFTLKWCFGVRKHVPVINLSNQYRGIILYAVCNVGVIYDYHSKTMQMLQGHKNSLNCLSIEGNGNFIASADKGDDSTIIVWDATTCQPIHTIFNKPEDFQTDFVNLSQNGKYLVTVSRSTNIRINFWLWTYGNDNPDDVLEIDAEIGACKNISFHPNCQEHIMLAFEKQIIFLYWHEQSFTLRETAFPLFRKGKSYITDCTYVEACHESMASTSNGCIIVFGNTLYARNYDEAELDNSKYYVKTIRVTKHAINCIRSTDELIITGDVMGHILFFDKRIKLLYWCVDFQLGSIISISFNLQVNTYSVEDFEIDEESIEEEMKRESVILEFEDRSEETINLKNRQFPSDATLQKKPFVVKDFIILTKDGSISLVDYTSNKTRTIRGNNESDITAIDTHVERPYIVIAYQNGKVSLYNYETHSLITKHILQNDENGEPIPVTCIKYSPLSMRLACGRKNGEVWFLEPILLTEISATPLQATAFSVLKICFSPDSMYAAYYDSGMTVVALKFDQLNSMWVQCGKVRSHYKLIRDIMFSPYKEKWKLLTLSEDRCLIQYTVESNCTGILEIDTRERVEQTATPLCFIYYPIQKDCSQNYILYADDQFKYKIITDSNFLLRRVLLGPAYGCYQESPVQKLMFMPGQKYMIFMTNKYIGFQILPTDGSPFNHIGMICHPNKLADCCLSSDGKYLFSFGENERCIFKFKTNTKSADFVATAGGPELEPFYCLLEGGVNGWLFSEMKDLFYYMQILHQGENTVLPRIVSDKIPILELADLMKACGYYPSDYEIENLIVDAKYRYYDINSELTEQITFIDFVKLYLNHRPPHGIAKKRLEDAFTTFCHLVTNPESDTVDREKFMEYLCSRGEAFTRMSFRKCLLILLNLEYDMNMDDFEINDYLPEEINIDYLVNEILGIDMDKNFDDEKLVKSKPTVKK